MPAPSSNPSWASLRPNESLDVDRRDRPRAAEEPEHDERGRDRPERRAHAVLERRTRRAATLASADAPVIGWNRSDAAVSCASSSTESSRSAAATLLSNCSTELAPGIATTFGCQITHAERDLRRARVVRLGDRAQHLDEVVRARDVLGQEERVVGARADSWAGSSRRTGRTANPSRAGCTRARDGRCRARTARPLRRACGTRGCTAPDSRARARRDAARPRSSDHARSC